MGLDALKGSVRTAVAGIATENPALKGLLAEVLQLVQGSGAARTYTRDELRVLRNKLAGHSSIHGVPKLLDAIGDLEQQMTLDLGRQGGLDRF